MKKKILLIPMLMLGLLVGNTNIISAYTGGTVSTGDNTDITMYVVLLGAAVVIAIVLLIMYKKKKK
ncbi:MAG: hypothetical protein ACK5LC_13810 [Coprobacillaceae bacterium]